MITRDYIFTLTPATAETVDEVARRARKILAWVCDGEKRIQCSGVDGEAFGLVQVSLEVKGRDRWACGQLAQDVIHMVTIGLRDPAQLGIHFDSKPTHTHRGYQYGRSKRWRAPRSS